MMKSTSRFTVLTTLSDMDERLLLLSGDLSISVNNKHLGDICVGGTLDDYLDVACVEKTMAKVRKN